MPKRGLLDDLVRDAGDLNVPTESPGATAPTDSVVCIRCSKHVAVAECDLCGLGYRCRACCDQVALGELAGRADVGDHLSAEDRERFARRGVRLALHALWVAAALVASSVVLLVLWPSPEAFKPMILAVIVGLAIGGKGYADWRRFRVR